MPVLAFFISELGLPLPDDMRWVSWVIALVSLLSYVLGRMNGSKVADLTETERLRMELQAAIHAAHKHEVEAVKWKTAYTTRKNTQWEMSNRE